MLINEVAKEIGFPELKDKQQEAALSFLKGNGVFVSLPTGLENHIHMQLYCLSLTR